MFNSELVELAAKQLAIDYSCNHTDFLGKKNRVTTSKISDGCRKFKDAPDFFKMSTMGKAVIASVSNEMLGFTTDLFSKFDGKESSLLFDGMQLYLINKQLEKFNKTIAVNKIYYLPKTPYKYNLRSGYNIRVFEENDIVKTLYKYEGFSNALTYNANGERHDMIAVCAVNSKNIIGMAGASNDSNLFWQIGIDIIPEFREKGLGVDLVSALTQEVFMHGAIPYYGTWAGNIASQNVARKSGFFPVWSEVIAFDIEKK